MPKEITPELREWMKKQQEAKIASERNEDEEITEIFPAFRSSDEGWKEMSKWMRGSDDPS